MIKCRTVAMESTSRGPISARGACPHPTKKHSKFENSSPILSFMVTRTVHNIQYEYAINESCDSPIDMQHNMKD